MTGKTWREKIEFRASRKSKCAVGGDILFFSDLCSKLVKTALLPLGTASRLKLVWGGKEYRILSVYRPYDTPPSSVGSLRNAMNKATDDFEETFWSLILKDSEVTTVIGGDFNLDGASVDERAAESTFFRVPYEEASSFRKLYLGSYQGSSIDHVLSNRGSVESYVTSDGLYMGDHFPVVAVIKTDSPSVVRNRLEVNAPPRLKSADKGGLWRLNRALEK